MVEEPAVPAGIAVVAEAGELPVLAVLPGIAVLAEAAELPELFPSTGITFVTNLITPLRINMK